MRKSTEIKTALDSTTKRLDELTEMRDGINKNLQTLQQGFIDGKTPLDELQAEQGKLATLNTSITTLEAKQSELETAFKSALNVETVKTGIGNLKTIAEEADAAFNEWDGLRVKLNEIITTFVDDIFSKSAEFLGKQREFRALFNQLEAKQSGVGINDELIRLGVSEKSRKAATTEYVSLTPCKFGQSIVIAEMLVGQEKYRKQAAIEKEAFETEREERRAAQKAKRDEEEAERARLIEADRAKIVQNRIDNNLPAYSDRELEIAVSNLQMRKADAKLRGATVSV